MNQKAWYYLSLGDSRNLAMLHGPDAPSSLNPASEYLLNLLGFQTVDERVDQWREKTVEEGRGYSLVGGHLQVGKERCKVDKETWYVVDRNDTALGGTG